MNLAVVLRDLDAEIEKLERVRAIVAGLAAPVRTRSVKAVPEAAIAAEDAAIEPQPQPQTQPAPEPEPSVVVVPPYRRREYRSRVRAAGKAPAALAGARPERPVFVPRATPEPVAAHPPAEAVSPQMLEAALRHNLLGGTA